MKKVAEGKRLIVLDDGGWEYVERKKGKEAVIVLAQTDDGRVILTEQYRPPVKRNVIDWAAGLVGDHEGNADPAEAAKQELEEETGYRADTVELLARGSSSAGITSEIISFYRAKGVRRVGEGGGVGGESITVHTIPMGELVDWLREQEKGGKLIDLKIWGGLYFLTQST